jgi:[ribosomal protein S5]-alanine N-acetyltransferase
MIIAETHRLVLRQIHICDSVWFEHILGDQEVMHFGPGAQTPQQVQQWIAEALNSYANRGFGPWAVVSRDRSEVIGYCGLFYFPDLCGQEEVEIGYRLARKEWGQGFATEAALAVRDYAIKTLSIRRLVAMVAPDNTASVAVATKLGMQYEKDVMFPDYSYPDHLYVLSS